MLPLGRTVASSALTLDPEPRPEREGWEPQGKQLQAENPWLSPLLSCFPFWFQQFWKQSVPLTERAKTPSILFQRTGVQI